MKRLLLALLTFLCAAYAIAANNTARVNVLNYASTNVTSGAAVTLVASSPISTSRIEVCDTSGQQMIVSSGVSGSAVSLFTVALNGCIVVPLYSQPGTQFNIQAVSASAVSGVNLMSFLP